MSIRDEIIEYLKRRNPDAFIESTHPENLKIPRILDSLQMLNFISFLETHFGIQIKDEDILSSHFRTIGSVTNLIELKAKDKH